MNIAHFNFAFWNTKWGTVNRTIDKFNHHLRKTIGYEMTELNNSTLKRYKGKRFDVGICWGTREHYRILQDMCDNVLVFENSYLNNVQGKNKEWISAGWNGLNGRADFCNDNSPSDRWEKHFNDGRLLDYSDGDYILLPLQIHNDMSLAHVENKNYVKIAQEIAKNTDLPIYVKQHPTRDDGQAHIYGKRIKYIDKNMPIEEAIKGAKAVVTINSNSGVDAVLGGKPVIATDIGSMVYELSQKFEDLRNPSYPDRTQWCNNIAYAQWHPDELASGEAWEHLKKKLVYKS